MSETKTLPAWDGLPAWQARLDEFTLGIEREWRDQGMSTVEIFTVGSELRSEIEDGTRVTDARYAAIAALRLDTIGYEHALESVANCRDEIRDARERGIEATEFAEMVYTRFVAAGRHSSDEKLADLREVIVEIENAWPDSGTKDDYPDKISEAVYAVIVAVRLIEDGVEDVFPNIIAKRGLLRRLRELGHNPREVAVFLKLRYALT